MAITATLAHGPASTLLGYDCYIRGHAYVHINYRSPGFGAAQCQAAQRSIRDTDTAEYYHYRPSPATTEIREGTSFVSQSWLFQ